MKTLRRLQSGFRWLYRQRIYLLTALREFRDVLVLQPRCRETLRSFGDRDRPHATLYYNFTGRLLFACREILAALTGNRLLKCRIRIEGVDPVDLAADYAKGRPDLIWPRPPSVETAQPPGADRDLLGRLDDSYALAYDKAEADYPNSPWWETMVAQYKEAFFSGDGRLRAESLEGFLSGMKTDSNILTDSAGFADPDTHPFWSRLKGLELVLNYHRHAAVVGRELLASVSESRVGGTRCPVYRGKRLSSNLLSHAVYTSHIEEHVRFDSGRPLVLEVGGGYGGLLRLLRLRHPDWRMVLVELPEACSLAGYYLSASLPGSRIGLLADVADRLDDLAGALDDHDILVLPPWCLPRLPDNCADLFVNTRSMAEMSPEYGRFSLEQAERTLARGGWFYSQNRPESKREGYGDFGFYKWQFRHEYTTVLYRYTPMGAPSWLGRKLT